MADYAATGFPPAYVTTDGDSPLHDDDTEDS